MNLIKELKRRNVIRMAGLYLVGAWLIIQIAETLLPAFDVPGWVLRAVIILLALGFIPALIFSWLFELTPDGLKRDSEVTAGQSISAGTAQRMDRLIFAGLLVLIAMIAADRLWPREQTAALSSESAAAVDADNGSTVSAPAAGADETAPATDSIAVLPFVNMSSDAEQSYFADGISEEILNALVRIPNLKVAGRTSSFSYKDQNEDLKTIGTELGVDHILEGSVRQAGTRIRITAQLIRSEDGFHLWSETFDREVSDIFAVQDEIARTVADKLQLSLGLGSKALVTDTTDDLKAYENFLKARQLYNQRGYQNLRTAALLLNESIARDPDYSPAWALLAGYYNTVAYYAPQPDIDGFALLWKNAALASAQRAVELNPDSALAQVTLGSALGGRLDWTLAFEALDRALALGPDDPAILDIVAQNLMQVGYFDEARPLSLRAVELDPRVAIYRNSLANVAWGVSDMVAARQHLELARQIDPDLSFPRFNLVVLHVCLGDADAALDLLLDSAERGELSAEQAVYFKQLPRPAAMSTLKDALIGSGAISYRSALNVCLGDIESALNVLQTLWDNPARSSSALFDDPSAELWSDPRWKAQVRNDGVLDLWRARGFPSLCKPVGEDDFECVAGEIKQ